MMATRNGVANNGKDNNQPCDGNQQWTSGTMVVDGNGGGGSSSSRSCRQWWMMTTATTTTKEMPQELCMESGPRRMQGYGGSPSCWFFNEQMREWGIPHKVWCKSMWDISIICQGISVHRPYFYRICWNLNLSAPLFLFFLSERQLISFQFYKNSSSFLSSSCCRCHCHCCQHLCHRCHRHCHCRWGGRWMTSWRGSSNAITGRTWAMRITTGRSYVICAWSGKQTAARTITTRTPSTTLHDGGDDGGDGGPTSNANVITFPRHPEPCVIS